MRTYTDTDREIQCLCSCEVCGDWYWRPQFGMFTCDDCKEILRQRKLDYARKQNGEKYSINPSVINKANQVFQIIVDHKTMGISMQDLRREVAKRDIVSHVQTYDYFVMLERTGHLVWVDEFSNLRPYKNLNTGERYD